MADEPQGLALFGGIATVISADYTMSHGITPGVCTLVAAPQAGFEAVVGPLAFTFGDVVVELPDCKVASHVFRQDGTGQRWSLAIHDRRWKWAFGRISLNANVRFENDNLDDSLVLTPQVIAGKCLKEMGETEWDVGQMPNDARPLIQWDRVNPARALADVAEQLGCRVVLGLDNIVHVVLTGVGAELPGESVAEASPAITIPDVPRSLIVSCGRTRHQVDFVLAPVGLERDGSIVLIDKLSYAPPRQNLRSGWLNYDPFIAQDILGVNNGLLAKQSVYFWYRINGTAGDPDGVLKVPGFGIVENGFQILPIEDVQVQTYEDAGLRPPPGAPKNAQHQHSLPAQVFGTFWDGSEGIGNSAPRTPYPGEFTVDTENGMVRFKDWVVQTLTDAFGKVLGHGPATLFLRCAFSIRNTDSWSWNRYERQRIIGEIQTPPRLLKHDEIVLNYYATYHPNGALASVGSNLEKVNQESDYYLDAAAAEYQFTEPQEVAYDGIKAISPDGAIQQVSWHIGEPHATTRGGRNNEFSFYVPSYEQRRRDEQVRQLIDKKNENLQINKGL